MTVVGVVKRGDKLVLFLKGIKLHFKFTIGISNHVQREQMQKILLGSNSKWLLALMYMRSADVPSSNQKLFKP